MKTINEHITEIRQRFLKLSPRYRKKLEMDAQRFIYHAPGCADHSNFWRGLSARQVIETNRSEERKTV